MKIQDRILKYSGHPAFAWVVFVLTVCESIFLFIPPEVFMTPPIVANKKRALSVTIAAAAGSLIGGAIAYMIGLWFFKNFGMWILESFTNCVPYACGYPEIYSHCPTFITAKDLFATYGTLIIVLAAVTPIPYKVMAICAGFLGFPAWKFILVSAIFRTGRFAIVGYLLYKFQGLANKIVKKYFWPLTIGAIAAALLGITLITFL